MKRWFTLGLLLAAVLSLAFAGGGGQRASSGGAGAITLRFIDVSPSPARQAYYNAVFEAFKAETGVTVNYESVPWDDAANKLTVLGASGSLPDVMTTWEGWLGQFTQAGWVVSLEKYIAGKESTYTDAVTKKLWPNQKSLYGSIYTVPDGLMVKGMFVRRDWAREKGLNLDPAKGWTYDEYFDAVRRLTDTSQRHYGVSYRGARGAFDPLSVYLTGFTGGRFYDDQGNVLVNSPECLDAFKKWTDLYLSGYAPRDAINWGFTEMVDNFTGGLTATLLNDSEVAATCQTNMQSGQWMVMPMPRSKDGKIYNTINAPYSYSISTHSKNPEAAWRLIEFLNRPDNSIEYCKMGGLIPIKRDIAGDATYGENGPYSAFVRQLNDPDTVIPASFGPFNYTDMHQGMMHEEVQKYLLGQQDAKTALDNICNELQARMKKYLADNPGATVQKPIVNF
ncbi:MAG: sugar ABC transporter substrate-binding protein [Spirochaetaceae bacterium]|nr:sugar ABC transporter substrate-binding protein [Spirochaetaceae bacterium]